MRSPTPGTVTGKPALTQSALAMGWVDALAVFVVTIIDLRLLPDCFSLFDEGVLADIADRLNRGDVLYRDVFTYWNPGGFWLAAGLFRVAGTTVTTLRISLAILGAVGAVMVWRLARGTAARGPALIAGLAAPLICYPIWWMASSHWYATFTVLAAALALQRCLSARSPAWPPLATGMLCGASFVMLQPVGVFVTIAVAVALAWDAVWTDSRAEAARQLALLAIGTLPPLLAMYAVHALQGALPAMLYATIEWNLLHFRDAVRAPYGQVPFGTTKGALLQASRALLMLMPPALYVAVLTRIGRRYMTRIVAPADRRLFAVAAVGCGLLAGNYYLPDLPHLAFAAPPSFAVLMGTLAWASTTRTIALARIATVLLLAMALAGGAGWLRRQRAECHDVIVTSRGSIRAPQHFAADLRDVFAFVARELRPGEPIFVYPYGPGYNFLTAHPNPTPYEYLFPNLPGFHSPEQYAGVVAALETSRPRYVIVSLLFGGAVLQRYDTPVEQYLRAHYRPLREFPLSAVWKRTQ